MRLQFRSPSPVGLFAMLPAIDLHDQHRLKAHEIRYPIGDRMLKAPLQSADLAMSDTLPNAILRLRAIPAKLRGVTADLTTDGGHHPGLETDRKR